MEAAAVMRGEKKIEDILFKMPKDGRIWGTKYPRPTAEQKVIGTLKFGQDLGLEMPPDIYYEQKVVKGPDTAPIMEPAPYVAVDSFYLQRQPHLTIGSDFGLAY